MVEAARRFADRDDLVFVINGGGSAQARPASRRPRGSTNLRFVEMQPRERLPEVLAAGRPARGPAASGGWPAPASRPSCTRSWPPAARCWPAWTPAPRWPRTDRAGRCGHRRCRPRTPTPSARPWTSCSTTRPSADAMGASGRRFVEEWVSPAAVAAAYERLFEDVRAAAPPLSEHRRGGPCAGRGPRSRYRGPQATTVARRMGKASSSKKIKRVQQAGVSRAPGPAPQPRLPGADRRASSSWDWCWSVLAGDAPPRRSSEVRPTVDQDHWVRGARHRHLRRVPAATSTPSRPDAPGIDLHADGLIHIHPTGEDDRGRERRVRPLRGVSRHRRSATASSPCPTARPTPTGTTATAEPGARGAVRRGRRRRATPPSPGSSPRTSPARGSPRTARPIVLAFAPEGAEVPLPPSVANLDEPDDTEPEVVESTPTPPDHGRAGAPRASPPTAPRAGHPPPRPPRRAKRPPPPPEADPCGGRSWWVGSVPACVRSRCTRPSRCCRWAGVTMLERVVAQLGRHGRRRGRALARLPARRVHRREFPDGLCAGVRLLYAVEPEPLDTAGAIAFAAREAGIDDRVLAVNGDVLTDLDVGELWARHERLRRLRRPSPSPRSTTRRATASCRSTTDGRVEAFIEKPDPGTAPSNWINAGTYVLEPTVLGSHPEPDRQVSIEREIFPALVEQRSLFGDAVRRLLDRRRHPGGLPAGQPGPARRRARRRSRPGVDATARVDRGRRGRAAR